MDDAFHGNSGEGGVLPHELVDAVARETRPACPASLGRPEQGRFSIVAVRGELEVFAQDRERGRVDRHVPGSQSLSGHPDVQHTTVLLERSDREADDLVAPEPVVEQGGEECPVA